MSNMDHHVADGNDALDFLKHFFDGATDGYIVVWGKNDKRTHSFHISDMKGAVAKLDELSPVGDTYAARGLQQSAVRGFDRGDEEGVRFVSGVWADIDTREGPHGSPKKPVDPMTLPADLNEALALVQAAGLPDPTVIIHTGGGCHLHWTYAVPVMLMTEAERVAEKALAEAWLARLRAVFKARGYKLDGVADLCRVVKIPNTWNHKTNPAKPVRLVTMGQRIERDDVLNIVATELKVTTKAAAKIGGASALLNDQAKQAAIAKAKPDNLASVLAGCAWMEHCEADAASLPEPSGPACSASPAGARTAGFCRTSCPSPTRATPSRRRSRRSTTCWRLPAPSSAIGWPGRSGSRAAPGARSGPLSRAR